MLLKKITNDANMSQSSKKRHETLLKLLNLQFKKKKKKKKNDVNENFSEIRNFFNDHTYYI